MGESNIFDMSAPASRKRPCMAPLKMAAPTSVGHGARERARALTEVVAHGVAWSKAVLAIRTSRKSGLRWHEANGR